MVSALAVFSCSASRTSAYASGSTLHGRLPWQPSLLMQPSGTSTRPSSVCSVTVSRGASIETTRALPSGVSIFAPILGARLLKSLYVSYS